MDIVSILSQFGPWGILIGAGLAIIGGRLLPRLASRPKLQALLARLLGKPADPSQVPPPTSPDAPPPTGRPLLDWLRSVVQVSRQRYPEMADADEPRTEAEGLATLRGLIAELSDRHRQELAEQQRTLDGQLPGPQTLVR